MNKPDVGEVVLWCEHGITPHHYFAFAEAEGKKPQAVQLFDENDNPLCIRWIILCDDCFERFQDPLKANLYPAKWNEAGDAVVMHAYWKN